jgi:predicted ArsR family transcriptional regulator
MARKPTDTVQLKLRFPEALRRRLVREAARRGQSLNGYIVRILEAAFQQSDSVQQRAQAIAEALGDEIVKATVEEAMKIEEAPKALVDLLRREGLILERGKNE